MLLHSQIVQTFVLIAILSSAACDEVNATPTSGPTVAPVERRESVVNVTDQSNTIAEIVPSEHGDKGLDEDSAATTQVPIAVAGTGERAQGEQQVTERRCVVMINICRQRYSACTRR